MNGLGRLQEYLLAEDIDGILIDDMANLHYFAGFTGTTGLAFVTGAEAFFITDSRYIQQASDQCEGYSVVEHARGAYPAFGEILRDHVQKEMTKLAVVGNHMTVNTLETVKKEIGTEITIVPVTLEHLRAVKNEEELEYMRKAAAIGDAAFAELLKVLKVGMTENEARIVLESAMLRLGSEGPSFDTIVASGVRSSMPHGVASDKVIEEGDFVTFDFGAIYKGYHSDMTRTVVMGRASGRQKIIYEAVLAAQKAGVAAVRPGLTGEALDKLVRDMLKEQGYGEYFRHGLGHGVGLDIHELPVASPSSTSVLEENMVVTVEPGVYFDGDMGLRIEDSVIVTADGCEILTKTPKELLEIF